MTKIAPGCKGKAQAFQERFYWGFIMHQALTETLFFGKGDAILDQLGPGKDICSVPGYMPGCCMVSRPSSESLHLRLSLISRLGERSES